MQNITDPKTIENHFRLLVDLMNDAIVIFDMEGMITNINDNFIKMIGCSKDKLVGNSIKDFLDKKNKSIFLKHVNKRDDNQKQFKCTFITNDDLRFDTLISLSPFYDRDSAYKGSLAVIKDITKDRLSKKALKKQKQELETMSGKLEELNIAMNAILEDSDKNKRRIEEQIFLNMRELVEPYLKKLKNNTQDESQKTFLNQLESNMKKIISRLSQNLTSDHSCFTDSELQITSYIKEGKSSKEIADRLCVSKKTIDAHRARIRNKLGITNKNNNLRAHLLSIQLDD